MHAHTTVTTSRNDPMMSIIVRYIIKALGNEFSAPETVHDQIRLVIITGAYLVITFGYSLRGNEGLWVDADCLCRNIEVGKTYRHAPNMLVPLIGRFKVEDGYRMNVLPIVNKKRS